MKSWVVVAWPGDSAQPVRIEVEAKDQWRAVLAAGRTGLMPLDVRELSVMPGGGTHGPAVPTSVPGAWRVWP